MPGLPAESDIISMHEMIDEVSVLFCYREAEKCIRKALQSCFLDSVCAFLRYECILIDCYTVQEYCVLVKETSSLRGLSVSIDEVLDCLYPCVQ